MREDRKVTLMRDKEQRDYGIDVEAPRRSSDSEVKGKGIRLRSYETLRR